MKIIIGLVIVLVYVASMVELTGALRSECEKQGRQYTAMGCVSR